MKEEIIVHSQSEFDAIPKDFDGLIVIEKTIGVISVMGRDNSSVVAWDNSSAEARGNSRVEAHGNSRVEARGNSSVVAWDNSSVEARGNSSVEARGNSSVVARENSSVVAWDNSSVVAWGNSSVEARENSSVEARGNSRVEARGNSSVVAWGNSSVEAHGNSRVEARENSSVVAWDNSSVEARGNSSVEARGNSSVEARGNSSGKAFDNSRILILDKSAKFKNYMNAVIQNYVEPKYTKDIFVELAEKEKGKLVLYKSVDPETLCDFYTGKIKYELGQTVECPDWDPDESRECGGGLHLSPTARKTQEFNKGKILKCLVDSEDIVVYSGSIEKVRCKKVFPVAIVDKRGNIISENNRNEVHKD